MPWLIQHRMPHHFVILNMCRSVCAGLRMCVFRWGRRCLVLCLLAATPRLHSAVQSLLMLLLLLLMRFYIYLLLHPVLLKFDWVQHFVYTASVQKVLSCLSTLYLLIVAETVGWPSVTQFIPISLNMVQDVGFCGLCGPRNPVFMQYLVCHECFHSVWRHTDKGIKAWVYILINLPGML